MQGREKAKAKAEATIEKEMKEAFMRVMGRDLFVKRPTKGETERNKNCKQSRKPYKRLEEILISKRRSMSEPRIQEKKGTNKNRERKRDCGNDCRQN